MLDLANSGPALAPFLQTKFLADLFGAPQILHAPRPLRQGPLFSLIRVQGTFTFSERGASCEVMAVKWCTSGCNYDEAAGRRKLS